MSTPPRTLRRVGAPGLGICPRNPWMCTGLHYIHVDRIRMQEHAWPPGSSVQPHNVRVVCLDHRSINSMESVRVGDGLSFVRAYVAGRPARYLSIGNRHRRAHARHCKVTALACARRRQGNFLMCKATVREREPAPLSRCLCGVRLRLGEQSERASRQTYCLVRLLLAPAGLEHMSL
jgi:hypothetical protein